MSRAPSPYSGTYAPAGLRMTIKELKEGLKGLKIRAPNRKYSGGAYKSALPKEHESAENG